MSRTSTALIETANSQLEGIKTATFELEMTLRKIAELGRHESENNTHDVRDLRLTNLAEVTMPPHTGDRAMLDVRAAYVLQSYVNLGHPADQTEAADIAVRAGYSSGRGANVYFTHGWLETVDDDGGTKVRQITTKGVEWLKETGQRTLLAWLDQ